MTVKQAPCKPKTEGPAIRGPRTQTERRGERPRNLDCGALSTGPGSRPGGGMAGLLSLAMIDRAACHDYSDGAQSGCITGHLGARRRTRVWRLAGVEPRLNSRRGALRLRASSTLAGASPGRFFAMDSGVVRAQWAGRRRGHRPHNTASGRDFAHFSGAGSKPEQRQTPLDSARASLTQACCARGKSPRPARSCRLPGGH
jgi:hypothetical protein